MLLWSEIESNPKYQAKPEHEKRLIREDYFTTFPARDRDYVSLPPVERTAIERDFVYQGEPTISQGEPAAPSLLQRGLKALGIPTAEERRITPDQSADALIEMLAKKEGITLGEYLQPDSARVSPIGQAAAGFVDMATLGLPRAIEKAATGDELIPAPASTEAQVGRGLGTLGGLIFGPAHIGHVATRGAIRAVPRLGIKGTEKAAPRILKRMIGEGISLGTAIGAGELGEALSKEKPREATKLIADAIMHGGATGAIFGTARGVFPADTPVQRFLRIGSGAAALDVNRMLRDPERKVPIMDQRALEEKVFDYAMDVYFLWKGGKPLDRIEKTIEEAADQGKAGEEVLRGLKSEPVKPEKPAEAPAPDLREILFRKFTEQAGPKPEEKPTRPPPTLGEVFAPKPEAAPISPDILFRQFEIPKPEEKPAKPAPVDLLAKERQAEIERIWAKEIEERLKAKKPKLQIEKEPKPPKPTVVEVIESPRLEWESFLRTLSEEDKALAKHVIPPNYQPRWSEDVRAQIDLVKETIAERKALPKEEPKPLERLKPETGFGRRLLKLWDAKASEQIDKALKAAPDDEIERAYKDKELITPLADLVAQERAERVFKEKKEKAKEPTIPLRPQAKEEVSAKKPYDQAGRLDKLVEFFEGRIIPKDPRRLREVAQKVAGGDPREYTDDIYDAIEGAYNRRWRKTKAWEDAQDWAPDKAIKVAQETEQEGFGSRTRSLKMRDLQQFSTPYPLAEAVKYASDAREGETVLEPTAGTGNLLAPFGDRKDLEAIEIDPRRVAILELNDYNVKQADYLKETGLKADVIVTNPPWGGLATGKYHMPARFPFKIGDVGERFVVKNLRDLKEDGRLVALLQGGTLESASSAGFRKWLQDNHTIRAWIKSPPGAYKSRGASENVRSVLLVVDKGKVADAPKPFVAEPKTWEEYAEAIKPLAEGGTHARAERKPTEITEPAPKTADREERRPARARPEPIEPALEAGERQPAREPGRGVGGPGPERAGVGAPVVPEAKAERREAPEREPEGEVVPPPPGRPVEPRKEKAAAVGRETIQDIEDSPIFARYVVRAPVHGATPHPRPIVETRSLAGVSPPKLTYTLHKSVTDALVRHKSISQEQYDAIAAVCQANKAGHGALLADDVGVGKSREAAGVALEWLSTGQAKRILLTTRGDNNIEDLVRKENSEFDIVAGGKFPFKIVNVKSYKDAVQDPEALPVFDKAIYVIDFYNLDRYYDAIKNVNPDAIIGDEAHLYRNINGSSKGEVWRDLHKRLYHSGKFCYLTATPASSIADLEYLYGLKEWHTDGFEQWIQRVTGAMTEKQARRFDQETEKIEMAGQEFGAEATDIVTRSRKASFFKESDTFAASISPAEMEQIMRELKMKGKYISRDLWRGGVEFDVHTKAFTGEEKAGYNQFVETARRIQGAFDRYGIRDASKKNFTIRHFLQSEAKRRQFEPRLEEAVKLAKESLERGEQPVVSVINISPSREGEGNLWGAINAINSRDIEKVEETGEIIDHGEIPEALVERAELFEEIQDLPALKDPVSMVQEAFGEENVAVITGRTTARQRTLQMDQFQKGKRKVALISGAGKIGINLHQVLKEGRRHLIVTDYEWSALQFKQELGRVDRAGQTGPPKVTVLSSGNAGEMKFLATIANRMKGLGAVSKGAAESTGTEALEEFELGGPRDLAAMRDTYADLDYEDKGLFTASAFKDPRDKSRPAQNTSASMGNFTLDLQIMPVDKANEIYKKFVDKRREYGEEDESIEVSAKKRRGEVLRKTALADDLTIFEVKSERGKYGILQGLITPRIPQIRRFLPTTSLGKPRRTYLTFRAHGENISGLEVPWGQIKHIKTRFGLTVKRDLSPDAILTDLAAGDKIPLENDWVLRQRQDGRIAIDGARMADRTILQEHGADYSPVGNYWFISRDNFQGFIDRFKPKEEVLPEEEKVEDDVQEIIRILGDETGRVDLDLLLPRKAQEKARQVFGRIQNSRTAHYINWLRGATPERIRVDVAEPHGPGTYHWLQNMEKILSQTKEGRNIYEAGREFKQATVRKFRAWQGEKAKILNGLGPREIRDVLNIVDGRETIKTTPKARDAADRIRGLLDEVHGYMTEQGVKVAYRQEYLPHIFQGKFWLKVEGKPARKFDSLSEALKAAGEMEGEVSIWQDTFIPPDDATMLSRRGYWRLVKKLRDTVGDAVEIADPDMVRDMLKGVARPKPRRRFFGNLLPRVVNNPNYLQDLDKLLDIYFYGASRKVSQERFLRGVQTNLEKMPQADSDLRKFVENQYMPGTLAHPTSFEQAVARVLHNWKISPGATGQDVRRLLHNVNMIQYVYDLGLSMSSSVANASQVFVNTYPIIGERPLVKGYADAKRAFRSKEMLGELNDMGILQAVSPTTGEIIRSEHAVREFIQKMSGREGLKGFMEGTLMPFSAVELLNRVGTYYGGKYYAQKELMKGTNAEKLAEKIVPKTSSLHDLAVELEGRKGKPKLKKAKTAALRQEFVKKFGYELVEKTQFRAGRENLPLILRESPIRLASPYKTFLINQLKYTLETVSPRGIVADPVKALRFAGMTYALAGIYGNPIMFAYFQAANWLAKQLYTLDLEKELRKHGWHRGLLAKLGLDISGSIAVMLPKRIQDIFGRFGKIVGETFKWLYEKLTDRGTVITERKVKRLALPAQAQRAWDAVNIIREGEYRAPISKTPVDMKDKPWVGAAKRFFGILPGDVGKAYDDERAMQKRKARYKSLSADLTERWAEAVKTKNTAAQSAILGKVVRQINDALDKLENPASETQLLGAYTDLLFYSQWMKEEQKFKEAILRKYLPRKAMRERKLPKYLRPESALEQAR